MRAVWCDPLNGSWPDWAKFRKYGITRVYVDARETVQGAKGPLSRLNPLIDGIHAQGFEAGVYRDPVWGGWTTPEDYALLASKDIRTAETDFATGKQSSKQIAYMHDLETHDVQWILRALRQWRVYRPSRMTDVTWEPLQGGLWVNANDRQELLSLLAPGGGGGIYHQHYGGGMQPVNAEDVRGDLVAWGFPNERLFGFYDGAALPVAWDGCIFTANRLAA